MSAPVPMPGFPELRIHTRTAAEPGIVLLIRRTIPESYTAHPEAGPVVDAGSGHRLFPLRDNPFSLRSGWLLRATGPKAEAERGGPSAAPVGPSTADRLRRWYRRLPRSAKIDLRPLGVPPRGLPQGDPLRAPGPRFERFVTDECIPTLLVYAARGDRNTGLAPVQFAVRPYEKGLPSPPIEILGRIFALYRSGRLDEACELAPPRAMTLEQAAVGPIRIDGIDYPTLRYPNLNKAISARPGDLWERFWSVWTASDPAGTTGAERQRRETARQIIRTAYDRILLHRFLRGRWLTPRPAGHAAYTKKINDLAWLVALSRMYRFDRKGCPVELDTDFLERHGLKPKSVQDRQLHHPQRLSRIDPSRRGGRFAKDWGARIYEILGKRYTDCYRSEE